MSQSTMEMTMDRDMKGTMTLDEDRKRAMMERLVRMTNEASMTLMLSIGHRTGLFDVMAQMTPATSERIAREAGLQERYVREWLGAMVTGGVVEYDPVMRTYTLPAEHAALMTRAAGGENLAGSMQWFSVLGSAESEVVDKFRRGGGVCYDHFHRFHDVMAGESDLTTVVALREHILPLVPGLTERLERGIHVLEVGCGQGRAMTMLAEMFPRSTFRGYDLCEEPIMRALATVTAKGLTNVSFEVRDVTGFDEPGRYDLVMAFDAIHDQKDPASVLRGIRRALRPGGVFLMQDIAASSHLENNVGHPLGTFFYTISTMHCMTVSLAQDGAGLGTCWGRELAQIMLRDAGFTSIEITQLPHDMINDYYVAR
ncbi:MAG: methyltransferase domain-containing protein [Phycisphaeraceae bacterium]|nr:methyltransferase domain-containing protein [Phycisphaeraceae bacterium]